MASTSETGHDVNLSNYKLMITRCETFTDYAPGNPDLVLTSMTAQWTVGDTAHSSYLLKLDETKEPINEREVIFVDMKKIVTRANNMFAASKASKAAKKDVYGLVKKILGRNIKVKYLPDGKIDPKNISNSQLSYVKMTKNFEQLINILELNGNYNVNEPILKIANLKTILASLVEKNDAIQAILAVAFEFKIKRDHCLYDLETGIYDTALLCKRYVKGLYGAKSEEAISITSIKFRRFMKLNPAQVLPPTP